MITFKCAERLVEWDGTPYFFKRLNNRWYFLLVLAYNSRYGGGETLLDQLREIRQLQAPTIGRQIDNWFNEDPRVKALAGYKSPTKGPYFLNDRAVEILDGESVFRELGLNIEPSKPHWQKKLHHLDAYLAASSSFQKGQILAAVRQCNKLISRGADHSIRFECGLLLARAYTAVGFFKEAKRSLQHCDSAEVGEELRARVKITNARVDYFSERYDDARRALEALRYLPWHAQAEYEELSALLKGREYKRLPDQAEAATVPAEKRRLRVEAKGLFDDAHQCLERALSLRLLHGDPHGLQATCFNLGNLIWRKRPCAGRNWITTSESISKRWAVGQDTILAKFVLARIDLHEKKYPEAWQKATEAFDEAHKSDNVFDRATAHRQHARYYFSKGEAEDIRAGLAHTLICFRIYTALNLQESLFALGRDFGKRVSEARDLFGEDFPSACRSCSALPVLADARQNLP